MSLNIVMMGTGTFALPTFRALLESSHRVVALVTQPDRVLRGSHVHPHPMKEEAVTRGVAVLQPEKVNRPEFLAELRSLQADIFVVAAYGQILSADLLHIPRLGAINLHGSLLPKYRGAAPIQYAVLRGEEETGVTIFQIEPKLDAGPIYGSVRTPIEATDTSGTVHDRLAELAAPLTLDVLNGLDAGTLPGEPQNASAVTKAPKIPKEMGVVDWSRSRREIDCHVRAMQPWPLAWTFATTDQGKSVRLIVLRTAVPADMTTTTTAPPGTILSATDNRLVVQTADGPLEITELQPTGKRPMASAEFLRGTRIVGSLSDSEG